MKLFAAFALFVSFAMVADAYKKHKAAQRVYHKKGYSKHEYHCEEEKLFTGSYTRTGPESVLSYDTILKLNGKNATGGDSASLWIHDFAFGGSRAGVKAVLLIEGPSIPDVTSGNPAILVNDFTIQTCDSTNTPTGTLAFRAITLNGAGGLVQSAAVVDFAVLGASGFFKGVTHVNIVFKSDPALSRDMTFYGCAIEHEE